MSALLETGNLCFNYPDPSIPAGAGAIQGLEVQIHPGERVGLIGPNGAGKTTFFLLACGILTPTSGEIRFKGQRLPANTFNPQIALVFQKSDDQLFCPSVWEDVAFGPQNLGFAPEAVNRMVERSLRAVGAEALAPRPVHHLSEGEKRIVAIAGALAMEPELVIYDEPSASLDIRSRRRLISLLKQSRETVLVASHDLELILEVCNRVLLMDAGRIVADGPPAQLMADEELMAAHGQEKPHSLVPHQIPHHR